MKRRELKPVLFATSAIFEVPGWAKKFSTAYSTTGCPSSMPAARSSSATSTTLSFSAGVGAARTRSRSSLARRPHRSSSPTCWLCSSSLGSFRKGTAPAGRSDMPTTQVCSSVSIAKHLVCGPLTLQPLNLPTLFMSSGSYRRVSSSRRFMTTELRNFLSLSYDELEQLNLKAKEQRQNRVAPHKIQEDRIKYLTDEKRIKAVTVLFSDLEGRLHMLDYDKKFLIKSWDNLTFDGSSIRGFTAQRESDLRLAMDWSAFYWGPADYFGSGKVMVFGHVIDKDGSPYSADIRGALKGFAEQLHKKEGYTLNAANEIEGFLFKGPDAERHYHETQKFEYVNTGGYYHSLPGDLLRGFIDTTAEVQRAMGFQNEKDHPEVAPSQFEINYGYGEVVAAAAQIQIYKLVCRQVATHMGLTASFLPKPVVGVNGSGMHTNVSVSKKGKNLFWDPKGEEKLSKP